MTRVRETGVSARRKACARGQTLCEILGMANLLLLLYGAYVAAGDAKKFEVSGFPKHMIFELGLNRGQTLTDLLTSEGSDRNLLKPILNGLSRSNRFSPSEWCIHGFEANPVFTAELQQLESSLSKRGLCVHLNTEIVAADTNRITTFYVDGRKDAMHGKNGKYFAEGSTADRDAGMKLRNVKTINATSVDFASYLDMHLLAKERRVGAIAVLRMDIEGGEYTLLPYLLQRRDSRPPVICKLDLLVIEFHSKRIPSWKVNQHTVLRDQLHAICPELRVVLDPSNYMEHPWKRSWPRPKEWAHIANLNPYVSDSVAARREHRG